MMQTQTRLNDQLQKEKEKLDKLIEQAVKNDIPLSQDKAVQMQTRKVDALVIKAYKFREKHRNMQKER